MERVSKYVVKLEDCKYRNELLEDKVKLITRLNYLKLMFERTNDEGYLVAQIPIEDELKDIEDVLEVMEW